MSQLLVASQATTNSANQRALPNSPVPRRTVGETRTSSFSRAALQMRMYART